MRFAGSCFLIETLSHEQDTSTFPLFCKLFLSAIWIGPEFKLSKFNCSVIWNSKGLEEHIIWVIWIFSIGFPLIIVFILIEGGFGEFGLAL